MVQISVIIPTYGTPLFLEKSIISVLNQSFSNLELIIVDDNNPDTSARKETEKLVCKYIRQDIRIKYVQHKCNMNGAVARNTGFSVAQGKYISLLDSDDEYTKDRLEKCYNIMESASDSVAGVYTGCDFRRSGKTYYTYTDVKDGNFLVETLACKFMFCTGSNIFVRKKVVDELCGFDGAFLRHQDYEFLVRIFEKKYSLVAIPEILVIKNNENFNLPDVDKLIAIKDQYLNKFSYLINVQPEKKFNYILHSNYIGIAENAMLQRKYKIANKFYNKANNYGRLSFRECCRRIVFPLYNILNRMKNG